MLAVDCKRGLFSVSRILLNWANSKTVGSVTEIAILAPVRKGRIPGERRTYEARLRFVMANLQGRIEQQLPTGLDAVSTIHFGRMIIVRPEQYLVHSKVPGVVYQGPDGKPAPPTGGSTPIPAPIDDFIDGLEKPPSEPRPEFHSWLLTLVSFDGDLKVYFKDIASLLNSDFDRIFCNCEDFTTVRDFEAFWTWIRRYQINVDLFYPRYPNLSLVRIKELEDFKRRFDAFVAKVRSPIGKRVQSMDELFDEFLRESQQHASSFPSPGGVFRTDGG
jgi:hypothetical protein